MHIARIPAADPAPATITAVLAMHTGHIFSSDARTSISARSELSWLPVIMPVNSRFPPRCVFYPATPAAASPVRLERPLETNLTLEYRTGGVTSVAGFTSTSPNYPWQQERLVNQQSRVPVMCFIIPPASFLRTSSTGLAPSISNLKIDPIRSSVKRIFVLALNDGVD
jgi:hypothetical protein